MTRTAFVGLGAMGAPMAAHLHGAGLLGAVWNRTRTTAEAFVGEHPDVSCPESLIEVAEAADVIVVCVSADDDLQQVVTALEPGLKPGMTVVDHSTVAPATARELHARLAAYGVAFVDAPVTGGVEGARNATLAIMVGGDESAVSALNPVFESYARLWHHLGPSGAGQSAKALNQLICAGIAEAVCEALTMVERLDLPREPMLELLGGGAAGSWFLDKRGRTMLADSFETGFAPELLLKDLKICRALLEENGFESAILAPALNDFQQMVDDGEPGRDISALIRLKRRSRS